MAKELGSILRAFLVCQVWAFVLFLPVNQALTSANNRYLMHWSYQLLAVYCGVTVLSGALLFGAGRLLYRMLPAWSPHIATGAAITSLSCVALALTKYWAPISFATLTTTPILVFCALGLAAILYRFGVSLPMVQRGLAKTALFMIFLVPIFWAHCLTYATYPQRAYTPANAIKDRSATADLAPADNVYIFVFDEWSYRFTFENDEPGPNYPQLQAFAKNATTFTNAYSPGCHTMVALPRILFGRNDLYGVQAGKPGFWQDGEFLDCADLPSLFSKARRRGYRTSMIGWHHPYQSIVGSQVDYLYSMASNDLTCYPAPWIAPRICWYWTHKMLGPELSFHWGCGIGRIENYAYVYQIRELLAKTRAVLDDRRRRGQFAVIHLPIPHAPFIFKPDGSLHDPWYECNRISVPRCRDNHRYMDRLIGGFLAQLKKRGKFDNSLIVLTSDHAYRLDPEMRKMTPREMTHIPLLIHFPHQREKRKVTLPFTTSNLLPLFDAVHADRKHIDHLDSLVARHEWYVDLAQEEVDLLRLVVK